MTVRQTSTPERRRDICLAAKERVAVTDAVGDLSARAAPRWHRWHACAGPRSARACWP